MNCQLQVINNSNVAGSFVIYQSSDIPQSYTLAWMSKYAYPSTTLTFNWNTTNDFVWSGNSQPVAGTVIQAGQAMPITPEGTQITFSYDAQNHAFFFSNQTQSPQGGKYVILMDSSVPPGGALVGVGMSGAPTNLINALPNMTAVFTPQPNYWLGFSSTVQQGEVIVTETLNPVQIVFPPNVNSMRATLNPDLTWTVVPIYMLKEEA